MRFTSKKNALILKYNNNIQDTMGLFSQYKILYNQLQSYEEYQKPQNISQFNAKRQSTDSDEFQKNIRENIYQLMQGFPEKLDDFCRLIEKLSMEDCLVDSSFKLSNDQQKTLMSLNKIIDFYHNPPTEDQ